MFHNIVIYIVEVTLKLNLCKSTVTFGVICVTQVKSKTEFSNYLRKILKYTMKKKPTQMLGNYIK